MTCVDTYASNGAPRLVVCAYFAPEIAAALALEGQGAVGIVPFRGRCDERPIGGHCPHPEEIGAPLLCGACAGSPPDTILPFELCFELLLGSTDLSSLLSQGCHLLTPGMVQAWPENVAAWGFSPETAREYFSDSVSRFVVLDTGLLPAAPEILSEIADYTGRPVEILSISLDYLRLMLRHVLGLVEWRAERQGLQAKLTLSQGLNSDLGMAYDLLAQMQPFPDEAAAVTGLLELFVALFAPHAVHYLPLAGTFGAGRSLPQGANLGQQATACDWGKAEDCGFLDEDGFHILVQKDQEVLGRVLVEGLAFPERREDYLGLATFVTPVLALFILNGRIHERLRTAEAVRREKNVLRAVLDAVPVWIAYLDRDGRIVVDNHQQAALFGLPAPQETKGTPWEVLTPLLLEEHHAFFIRCLAGETVPFVRELTENPDRKAFVSGTYVPVRQEDGQVVGAIVAISDISEPMRKEREQRDQEAAYHVIFDGSLDGILIADAVDRRFHHANPAICDLLGYRHEELMQMGVEDIHPSAELPHVRAAFESALLGGTQELMELPVRRKDGSVFPAEISATPIHLDDSLYLVGIFRDVSARKLAEAERLRLIRELETIAHSVADGLHGVGMDGRILFENRAAEKMLGYPPGELLGQSSHTTIHHRHTEDNVACSVDECPIYACLSDGQERGVENELFRRKDGSVFPVDYTVLPMRDNDGVQVGVLVTFRDITERKEAERRLRLNAAVFNNALEGIMITDQDNAILDVNGSFTAITGFTKEEVLGGNPRIIQSGLHDADFYATLWQEIKTYGHWGGEIWNRRKNGEIYAEWLTITTMRDDRGELVNYIGVFSDITFAKQHEKQLERIAHYDALTGIPNRVLLADRMKQAIAQAKRERKMLGVCYMDLDGFKPVNDTLGHQAGDHVLIEIARRISNTLREGDTVARLGGDEFVVLLPDLNHVEECMATLKRLHEAIALPICIEGQSFSLTASIGVSIFPDDDNDPDVLLRHADQAMYVAKQSGKNRYHLYDPTDGR